MLRFNLCRVFALVAVAPLFAQAPDEEAEDAADEAENAAAEQDADAVEVCRRWSDESQSWRFGMYTDTEGCEIVVVTGTRLGEDPTLRIEMLTAEDITARGLTTAEEILRAIPQNMPSINAYTSTRNISSPIDVRLGALNGVGVVTANLRALGSRNTLVLVNGRRIAGVAGSEEFYANVNNIPIAAIERVEMTLDGGAAVYGSDAVGGVVNFILKRDYAGVHMSGRYEHSATGGDQNRLDIHLGYSWGDGGATAIVARTESDPVNNHKTGFTTFDYRPRFGPSADYNFVGTARPRSGLISPSIWGPFRILPSGNDGRNAQPDDFGATTPEDYLDVVARDAGTSNEDVSVTLAANHTLFEKLTLRGEVLWREGKSKQQTDSVSTSRLLVPESNAFNNFGRDVWAIYYGHREIADGLITPAATTGTREHTRYALRLDYAWSDSAQIVVDHTYAVSDGFRRIYRFAAANRDLNESTEAQRNRVNELLSSSDPNVAVNIFGDGSGQNATVAELYLPVGRRSDRAYLRTTTAYFRGGVFDAPGGRAYLAAGGEARSEWIAGSNRISLIDIIGVPKPTRDLTAAFVELQVPLFGSENARPGLQQLTVTAKLRRDSYETEGAVGKTEDESLRLVKATFANVAPYIGIAYTPFADLTLRVSHAEGFVAPRFRELYGLDNRDQPGFTWDPLKGTGVLAQIVSGSNPDLQPELSTTLTAGFDWTPSFVEDLSVEVYYSDVNIRDRIANNFELARLLPSEVYGSLTQFFERAEDGTLLRAISTSVNISQRTNKSLDFKIGKTFPTNSGEWFLELRHNRVLDHFDQPFENSDRISMVGKSLGVDHHKTGLQLRWTRDATTVNAFVNHTPSYVNNDHSRITTRDIPETKVSSWTTLDASVQHIFDNGVSLQVGGRDLLGRDFPFRLAQSGFPWDPRRVDLRGRVLFLNVSYSLGR